MNCISSIATAPMSRTLKTEKLTVSPTLMDLLNENGNKNILLEVSPTLCKIWRICGAVSVHTSVLDRRPR
jgi:hypothetical protein